jgi:uncharacterized repeat protein (TIGR03809 family)
VLVASASVFLLAGWFMTHRLDAARGRDIVARWCGLAEQRLEYLAELFETGRWRRFHSEHAFLENIREAKAAVETWRDLSLCEASCDNTAIDMSWLGRARAAPRGERWRDPVHRLQPMAVEISAERPPAISIVPQAEGVADEEEALSTPPIYDEASELTPGTATIAERYPLLRNAL